MFIIVVAPFVKGEELIIIESPVIDDAVKVDSAFASEIKMSSIRRNFGKDDEDEEKIEIPQLTSTPTKFVSCCPVAPETARKCT